MSRSRPWRNLLTISWADRGLLLEAALWLGAARLALLVLPFRWLAPRLGATMAESPARQPKHGKLTWRIGWAVRIAGRYTPWKTRCLAQAMAAKAMLRRRGLASTLYLGLAKDERGELAAHAWLRCGGRVLTGGRLSDKYRVIAKFAEPGGAGSA